MFGLFFSAELSMETLVVAPRPSCHHAQGPASLGTPAAIPIPGPICPDNLHTRCLLLIAPTELPLHQGPRESTFFIGHTTSFQTHPFLAPAFDGLCIPDKSFGGAGFRMSPNTINYSWESKKQKSDSPSGKWSWRHLHIHYLKFLILARVK